MGAGRKKLILLAVVSAIAAALLVPAVALALSAGRVNATADVVVTDPGVSFPISQDPIVIRTVGEVIEGYFTSVRYNGGSDECLIPEPDDPLHLCGANIKVRHNPTITLDGGGGFTGKAYAFFTVKAPEHQGTLFGVYRARLSGSYGFEDGQLVIYGVTDTGRWRAVGFIRDDGRFVRASGEWEASLVLTEVAPGVWTLAGTATVDGHYSPIRVRRAWR